MSQRTFFSGFQKTQRSGKKGFGEEMWKESTQTILSESCKLSRL